MLNMNFSELRAVCGFVKIGVSGGIVFDDEDEYLK